MNKISVILPNYNDSRHLERWFSNLFSQSREPFEVVFVDDGSTDNSVAIVERTIKLYRLNNVTIIQNKRNMGAFKAFMRGVRAAKGDYIAPWSCDDEMLWNYVEAMDGAITEFPHVDIYLCKSIVEREGVEYREAHRERPFYMSPEYFSRGLRENTIHRFIGHVVRRSKLMEYWKKGASKLPCGFDALYIYFSALDRGAVFVDKFLVKYHAAFNGLGSGQSFKINRAYEKMALQICEDHYPAVYPRLVESRAFHLSTSLMERGALWLLPRLPKCLRHKIYEVVYGS